MRAVGLAADGGYSGEIVHDARTMVAIRLPFIVCARARPDAGVVDAREARLAARRVALAARRRVDAILLPDRAPGHPRHAAVHDRDGRGALFIMALEDGDRPIDTVLRRCAASRSMRVTCCSPRCGSSRSCRPPTRCSISCARRGSRLRVFPNPAVFLPLLIAVLVAGIASPVWRVIAWPVRRVRVANRLLAMAPITTMRQVYLLWCYALLGVSVLAKGPPGVVVVGRGRRVPHRPARTLARALRGRVRAQARPPVDDRDLPALARRRCGSRTACASSTSTCSRTSSTARPVDPDNSLGTFEYYTSQLGHGMWLWAALVPPALAAALLRARTATREGRVRFLIALWAICGGRGVLARHDEVPPLHPAGGARARRSWSRSSSTTCSRIASGSTRSTPRSASASCCSSRAISMWEPDRWIELFMFRYDRPWPSTEPWSIDPSDGFLALGLVAAAAIALACAWRRARRGGARRAPGSRSACGRSRSTCRSPASTGACARRCATTTRSARSTASSVVYYGARELVDDWATSGDVWTFETFIPDGLQVGQPMTLTLQVNKPDDERVTEQTVALVGTRRRGSARTRSRSRCRRRSERQARTADRARPREPRARLPAAPCRRRRPADRVGPLLAWRAVLEWRRDLGRATRACGRRSRSPRTRGWSST